MSKVILRKLKLTTIGGSLGFIVPKDYINNGDIAETKQYNVTVEEA